MSRTHAQIILEASEGKTDAELTAILGFDPARVQRIRDWRRRKQIPPEWWVRVESVGWCTVGELAHAVANPEPVHQP